jgi:hypothetical protein
MQLTLSNFGPPKVFFAAIVVKFNYGPFVRNYLKLRFFYSKIRTKIIFDEARGAVYLFKNWPASKKIWPPLL